MSETKIRHCPDERSSVGNKPKVKQVAGWDGIDPEKDLLEPILLVLGVGLLMIMRAVSQ